MPGPGPPAAPERAGPAGLKTIPAGPPGETPAAHDMLSIEATGAPGR